MCQCCAYSCGHGRHVGIVVQLQWISLLHLLTLASLLTFLLSVLRQARLLSVHTRHSCTASDPSPENEYYTHLAGVSISTSTYNFPGSWCVQHIHLQTLGPWSKVCLTHKIGGGMRRRMGRYQRWDGTKHTHWVSQSGGRHGSTLYHIGLLSSN